MKKALTVLVISLIIASSAFAAANDKLILDSTVKQSAPIIGIKTTNSSDATVTGSADGAHVTTGMNIATQDISWTFTVYQAGGVNPEGSTKPNVNYARYKGVVTISLTPEKFYRYVDNTKQNDYSSGAASVESATAKSISNQKVTVAAENKEIKATYDGKVESTSLELGTFTCKWLQNDSLPDGDYQADVKMTYLVD